MWPKVNNVAPDQMANYQIKCKCIYIAVAYNVLQILRKVYGEGQGSMNVITSVLNEWGQFLTTIAVASESEDCYRRMARGLQSRFRRANSPAPKILYTDNNCCR